MTTNSQKQFLRESSDAFEAAANNTGVTTVTIKYNLEDLRDLIAEKREQHRRSFLIESPLYEGVRGNIMENPHPFKAIYVFGPAGAGKSYISKAIANIPNSFVTLNNDESIEDIFPQYGISLKFAAAEEDPDLDFVQQTARAILQDAGRSIAIDMIQSARGVVFDTTGEDVEKMSDRIKALSDFGYDIGILQINVPPSVSVSADLARGEHGGRTVGAARVQDISDKYQKQVQQDRGYFDKLKDLPNVTFFGNDIYPNIFVLQDTKSLSGYKDILFMSGEYTPQMYNKEELEAVLKAKRLGKKLPDSIPESLKGSPLAKTYTEASKVLGQMKKDVQTFLTNTPNNGRGKRLLNAMKGLINDTNGTLGQTLPEVIIAAGIAKSGKKLEMSRPVSGAGTTDDPTVTASEEVDLSKKAYMTAILAKDLSGADSMAKAVEDKGAVPGPREKPPVADLGVRSVSTGKVQKKPRK
jgi:hypothetical protein